MDDLITNKEHTQVKWFKYLDSLVNKSNSIEEDINKRIVMGNKAFHANAALFKGK
jgi:hypothetical protein